jgi:transposase-like protein
VKPGRDPLTLGELRRRFNEEAACFAFLERARWPHGPVCPACGSINRASRISTRRGQFTCLECRKRFSVTSGTPMHQTHLPFCTWIIAAYLIATSSKGISSLKLASLLGLQYRTTWHLTHRIRAMMESEPDLLRGIVELDETYMGGKPRAQNTPIPPAPMPLFDEPEPAPPPPPPSPEAKNGKKKRHRKAGRGTEKPMAFTAVERGGKLRLQPVHSHATADFLPIIARWVDHSATLSTDELPAYLRIGRLYAAHIRVNHSAGEYAKTDARTGLRAHVNTAESVHAMFKRAIVGVFHWISGKHMGRYLREIEFRWNNRIPFVERLGKLFHTGAGPLPLKALFA